MADQAALNVNNSLPKNVRVITVAFCTAACFAIPVYVAAWAYAYSYDPRLTPRHTHYMYVWWGIGRPMFQLMVLLVGLGIALLVNVPQLRRRFVVWFPIVLMLLLLFALGPA